MNREIKFRAWATDRKEMIDLKKITPLALADGMLDHGDGLFIPFRKDIILMQFTGLLDKNGKEIYEGDILQCYMNGFPIGAKEIVEFKMGEFILRYRAASIKHWLFDTSEDAEYDIEVIGNIYENPELLQ